MVVEESWRDWLWRRTSELMLLHSWRQSDAPWQERAMVLLLLFAMVAWISRVAWRVRDFWDAATESPPASPTADAPSAAIALPRRGRRD